jgi:acetate---CoA ligase (ADP-forming)
VLLDPAIASALSLDSIDSIALVGARPGRVSTDWLPRNLLSYGFAGDIWLVSRRHREVNGRATFESVGQLPRVPGMVLLAVGPAECIQLTRECTGAGTKVVVVYANGFGETGTAQGRRLEAELAAAVQGDAVLIGPSSLGVADFFAGVCAFGPPIPADLQTGCVSLISQSGALLCSMLGGAAEEGLGIDWCASVGSGISFTIADALSYAAHRTSTRLIGLYFEGFQSAAVQAQMTEVLSEAAVVGKRVIAVKAGASAAGASVALSHTGSISGDDRLADAFFRRYGVIRVESFDDLLRTANMLRIGLARHKPGRPGQGLAIIEPSGGSTAVAADLAARYSVPLAALSDVTASFLADVGGPSAHVSNPVDLTAAAHAESTVDEAYRLVQEDSGVGAVLVPWSINLPDSSPARAYHQRSMSRHISLARATGVPLVIATASTQRWTDWVATQQSQLPGNVAIVNGVAATMRALRWILEPAAEPFVARAGNEPAGAAPRFVPEAADAVGPGPGDARPVRSGRVLEEARALTLLAEAGLPVARYIALARGERASAAVLADAGLRPPFAVKVIAPGLAHKADLGGVELGVVGLDQLCRAAEAVVRRTEQSGVPPSDVTGVLVAEMAFGPEILVGLSRDSILGDYLVLGWGGILTEAVGGHVIELLGGPGAIDEAVDRAIGRLAPAGSGRSRLQAIRQLLAVLCRQFVAGSLRHCLTIEVNPLILDPRGPVIADALAVIGGEIAA